MTGGLLTGKFNSSLLLTAEAQEQEKSVIANRYTFVFAQQNHGMDNMLLYPLRNPVQNLFDITWFFKQNLLKYYPLEYILGNVDPHYFASSLCACVYMCTYTILQSIALHILVDFPNGKLKALLYGCYQGCDTMLIWTKASRLRPGFGCQKFVWEMIPISIVIELDGETENGEMSVKAISGHLGGTVG